MVISIFQVRTGRILIIGIGPYQEAGVQYNREQTPPQKCTRAGWLWGAVFVYPSCTGWLV